LKNGELQTEKAIKKRVRNRFEMSKCIINDFSMFSKKQFLLNGVMIRWHDNWLWKIGDEKCWTDCINPAAEFSCCSTFKPLFNKLSHTKGWPKNVVTNAIWKLFKATKLRCSFCWSDFKLICTYLNSDTVWNCYINYSLNCTAVLYLNSTGFGSLEIGSTSIEGPKKFAGK